MREMARHRCRHIRRVCLILKMVRLFGGRGRGDEKRVEEKRRRGYSGDVIRADVIRKTI